MEDRPRAVDTVRRQADSAAPSSPVVRTFAGNGRSSGSTAAVPAERRGGPGKHAAYRSDDQSASDGTPVKRRELRPFAPGSDARTSHSAAASSGVSVEEQCRAYASG